MRLEARDLLLDDGGAQRLEDRAGLGEPEPLVAAPHIRQLRQRLEPELAPVVVAAQQDRGLVNRDLGRLAPRHDADALPRLPEHGRRASRERVRRAPHVARHRIHPARRVSPASHERSQGLQHIDRQRRPIERHDPIWHAARVRRPTDIRPLERRVAAPLPVKSRPWLSPRSCSTTPSRPSPTRRRSASGSATSRRRLGCVGAS
ncbi:hypothetical protein ACFPRL_15595 [Pseudoclavibacter helvolus]